MSATIPESMRLDDLLKATGYDCPAELQGKTFDQATEGGGSADLEDNKTATIDVSTYTSPVEVTPSEGKDGMKKVTVSLSNIPSGGSATAYAWSFSYNGELTSTVYLDFDTSPIEANDNGKQIGIDKESGDLSVHPFIMVTSFDSYTRNSDTSFTLFDGDTWSYTRDSSKDVILW